MPVLKKSKHELFAKAIACGEDYKAAYVAAGYAPSPQNAARLRDRADVKERIGELVNEAAESAGITIERVLRELSSIAFASADDYFHWDESGVIVKPSDMLTREQLSAVCQVEETRLRGERTIRVRLADKQRALELLGKHLGMFQQPSEPTTLQEHLHLHLPTPGEIIMERLNLLAKRVGSEQTPASLDFEWTRHSRDMNS